MLTSILNLRIRLLDDLDWWELLYWYLNWHKVDRNILGYMNYVWLLSYRDTNMDHSWGPGVVVMVGLMFVIVIVWNLLLDLDLLHWSLV